MNLVIWENRKQIGNFRIIVYFSTKISTMDKFDIY